MQSKAFAFLTGRFFDGISSGMFMMALPWLMLKNGASGVVVAMTALGCTVGSFVFTPWLATLIDRHSRKAILVCVQLIQVLTALTVLLGYWFQADSLELLIAAQMTFWWSGDLAWSANSAFTQENFESDEYPEISGRLEVVMQTTSLGSGAAGIFLLSYWSMIEFSLFAALASMIAAFCYMIMPYRRLIRINQSVPFLGQLVDTKNIFGRQPAFFLFIAF
jgi:DHA3 family macrolide efflux protein-like MFS transporter